MLRALADASLPSIAAAPAAASGSQHAEGSRSPSGSLGAWRARARSPRRATSLPHPALTILLIPPPRPCPIKL